jgi:hypothetical protein
MPWALAGVPLSILFGVGRAHLFFGVSHRNRSSLPLCESHLFKIGRHGLHDAASATFSQVANLYDNTLFSGVCVVCVGSLSGCVCVEDCPVSR